MDWSVILMRVLHVVLGVFWGGAVIFTAFFLQPAIRDAGPEGGKVMGAIVARGLMTAMPVAAILGSAPAGLQPLLSTPLPSAQFRYVSAHVGDDGDWLFQREHGLSWHESRQPLTGPIHVHFDLDALDPAGFPHVAYPEGKLSLEAALELMRTLAASGRLVGLTITEFAPADEPGAEQGGRFIARLCDAAVAAQAGPE